MKPLTKQQATAAVVKAARDIVVAATNADLPALPTTIIDELKQALGALDAIEEQTRQSQSARTWVGPGHKGKR